MIAAWFANAHSSTSLVDMPCRCAHMTASLTAHAPGCSVLETFQLHDSSSGNSSALRLRFGARPDAASRSSKPLHAGHNGSSTSIVGTPPEWLSSGTSTPYGSSVVSSRPHDPTYFEKSGASAMYASTGAATKPASCSPPKSHALPLSSGGGGCPASGSSLPTASLAHSAPMSARPLDP